MLIYIPVSMIVIVYFTLAKNVQSFFFDRHDDLAQLKQVANLLEQIDTPCLCRLA